MSFNPTRLDPAFKSRSNHRQPPPGAGTTHSQIALKYARPRTVPPGDKKSTPHGHAVTLFTTPDFVVRHEVMFQKNNIGIGVNPKGDRSICLIKGTLFVNFEQNGVMQMVRLAEGNYFHFPKGTKYSLATSGTDGADFSVVESVGYEKTWTQIETPTAGEEISGNVEYEVAAPQVVRRQQDPNAVANALEQAQQAAARRRSPKQAAAAAWSSNSANTIGVNPRPSGPQSSDE